jgi:hypothetical protein
LYQSHYAQWTLTDAVCITRCKPLASPLDVPGRPRRRLARPIYQSSHAKALRRAGARVQGCGAREPLAREDAKRCRPVDSAGLAPEAQAVLVEREPTEPDGHIAQAPGARTSARGFAASIASGAQALPRGHRVVASAQRSLRMLAPIAARVRGRAPWLRNRTGRGSSGPSRCPRRTQRSQRLVVAPCWVGRRAQASR